MRSLALRVALGALLGTACRTEPPQRPTVPSCLRPVAGPRTADPLVAIDVFGTAQLTRERLLAAEGEAVCTYLDAANRDAADLDAQRDALVAKLQRLGDFAEVAPSIVGYYPEDGAPMKVYVTIDFVDRADAARRRPWIAAPAGSYPDPDGLLAAWDAYMTTQHQLLQSGAMSAQRVACTAFHCLGNPSHPDLAAWHARFTAEVPTRLDALEEILASDGSAEKRATAAFLLAYGTDGARLVRTELAAFRDPSALVRNNAMRVVHDVVRYHPEVEVPLEPILAALDYPATTDRNKAAATLDGWVARPGAAARFPEVVRRGGKTLVAMLRLEQPNNHDFAWSILKTLSGKAYGERDVAAWAAWVAAAGG